MSTRYEDAQNDRSSSRRDSRDLDDRSTRAPRDVRQASENIREAGGDIVSNICGLWGNLFSSVSDAVSPRSSSSRTSNESSRSRTNTSDDRSQLFNCDGGEFKISCGPPKGGKSDGGRDSSDYKDSDDDEPTKASYQDGKRQVNIST